MDVKIVEKTDFDKERESYLFFLKESILNGDYVLNPRAIAANWLIGTFAEQPVDECTVD